MLDTLTPSRKALLSQIADLWEQGISTIEIGRKVGKPKNSICRLVHDARHRGDPRFPARNKRTPTMLTGAQRDAQREIQREAYDQRLRKLFAVEPPTLPVLTLRANQCRYPFPDRACPKHRIGVSPYCDEHHDLCIVNLRKR